MYKRTSMIHLDCLSGLVCPREKNNKLPTEKPIDIYRLQRSSVSLRGMMLMIVILLSSCTLMSRFDQFAYVQSTSLKVEVLSLIEEGTSSYPEKAADIRAMEIKLEKALEYERFRPKNQITLQQYQLLTDPEGNLVGGAFRLWKNNGKLSTAYIKNKKEQIAKAFDLISSLEAAKIK